ncbi:MAG: lipoyl synthase [Desulfovibrionaceae bacterium]
MRDAASQTVPCDGDVPALEVIELGRLDYDKAFQIQKRLVEERITDAAKDRLLLVEHPPVITLGLSGSDADLLVEEQVLRDKGVPLFRVDRGGKATFHGPGQLVAYPIIKLREKDLHLYLERMLEVVSRVLRAYGLTPELGVRGPGVWVKGAKIASVGMAVRKWVTYHGVALNVNTDLHWFGLINPCGYAEERMTSMKRELGETLDINDISTLYVREFCKVFSFEPPAAERHCCQKRPAWLSIQASHPGDTDRVEALLDKLHLGTVCQEANCPNMGECFTRGTSTFMILGTICTRGCRYCAVTKGRPLPLDPDEPRHVAEAVATLGIRHAVVTSVTRDDLADGGAGQFVRTIEAIRQRTPNVTVEVLVPDFGGSEPALQSVCDARPDVFNHNIETVPRLFPKVRPRAHYDLSMRILRHAANQGLATKSGLMLGLGETESEIQETLGDLYRAGCRFLTLGQYLAPTKDHAPIDRYVTPNEFEYWAQMARSMGFTGVASGPLVRSSYRAEEMVTPRDSRTSCGNIV